MIQVFFNPSFDFYMYITFNHIGGVMISMLASIVVDRVFNQRL